MFPVKMILEITSKDIMIFTEIKGTPLFSSTRFFAAARGKYFYPSSTDLARG